MGDWGLSLWIKAGTGRKSEENLGLKAGRAAESGSDTDNLCGLGQAAEALFLYFCSLIAFLSHAGLHKSPQCSGDAC